MSQASRTPGNNARITAIEPALFLTLATAVLLLAALLRLAGLQEVPPGLSQDEVLNADIVSFIWQGQHALFFREGFGHEPLYHYLAAPFQPLLGDNLLSIRLPAGFLGLLLVAAVIRWAGREFGRWTGLIAGLLLAISWWAIVFSRIGLRPILEPLLLVGAATFWPFPGRSDWRRVALAGIFLGLSLYSYTAAQVMLLLPILYAGYLLLYGWRQRRNANKGLSPGRCAWLAPIIVFAIAGIIFLPMLLTWRADPTLLQRVEQLSGPIDALQRGDIAPLTRTTLATLGIFAFTGDPRFTYMLADTPLFGPISALLFFAGLLLALTRARIHTPSGFILCWLLLGLVPSAVTPQAPSTVRMVGAMPVIYLLPALAILWGWRRAAPWMNPARPWLKPILGFLILLLLAGNLLRTMRDGFQQWPAELETRTRYQTVFRDIAADIGNSEQQSLVISESFFEPIDHDSVRRNLGRPLEARWVQQQRALVFPHSGGSRFYVPEYAFPDIRLLAAAGVAPEPLYRSDGLPSYAVFELPVQPDLPPIAQQVRFGQQITLLGHEVQAPTDGVVPVITWWRVDEPLPADLAIFVHLVNADGNVAAQDDTLDAVPASLQVGDVFLQLHLIPLSDTLPADPYHLELGLYRRSDGVRLQHPGSPADRILLDNLQIDDM